MDGSLHMRLRNLAGTLLVFLLAGSAHADEWIHDRVVEKFDGGEWGGCFAYNGTHDTYDGRFNSTLGFWINPWTISVRINRGDEDIFKPLAFLNGLRANAPVATSRPLDFPQFGIDCTETEENAGPCPHDLNEYRIEVAVNGGPMSEIWVQSFDFFGKNPYYTRQEAEGETPRQVDYAGVYWHDFPEEIFTTKGRQTITMKFTGRARFTPDQADITHHHVGWTTSLHGGDVAGRWMKICKNYQINAGHWDFAMPDEEAIQASSPEVLLRKLRQR